MPTGGVAHRCLYGVDGGAVSVAAAAVGAFAFTGAVAGVAATAAFAAAATRLGLEFFGSSIAYNGDLAFETHVLACQRMVEVHHNVGVGNVDNHAVDAETVLCLSLIHI